MRVEDAQEAIVVDEELSSLQGLAHVLPTVQHLNVAVRASLCLCGSSSVRKAPTDMLTL